MNECPSRPTAPRLTHLIRLVALTLLCAGLVWASLPDARAGERLEADEAGPGLVSGALSKVLPEGVLFRFASTLDALSNTRGGRSRGYSPVLLTELRVGLDFERLASAPGLSGELHVINHALHRINVERVGAITGVTNIEASSNTTKLYRAWLEQQWEDRGSAFRIGLFPLEDEFFLLDAAASFIHPTNGPQGDYASTIGSAIYNHAGFGIRFRQASADRSRYAMAALLDRPLEDTNFVRLNGLSFPRAPGLHLMVEVGLTPLEGKEQPEERSERFDKTAAGVWTYSVRDEHLSQRDPEGQPQRSRSAGWYLLREATLWASDRDPFALAGFIRLSGADARATPIRESLNLGLRAVGWVPGRPEDVSSLMIAIHRMGQAWHERALGQGQRAATSERVLEINHRIELTRLLSVMPLAQWISSPGGLQSAPASRVIGARITLQL